MKTIKVQTKKIYSHDEFGNPNIETCVISLNEGGAFDGFIRFLNSQRYMTVPSVQKVIENDKDITDVRIKDGDISNAEYFQIAISNVYGKKADEKVDYKKKAEDQEQLIAKLKAQNESFESRFKALEGGNNTDDSEELNLLQSKYYTLFGKEPDKRMKLETLKTKIEDKENE